ncbi:MAG: polyprenyl synthetase family protein [Candidatus Krumholzibacteria bacterium]|nr:polyprenyl synthetase family protein [Candidatus Krumholzibacteria bacterium]
MNQRDIKKLAPIQSLVQGELESLESRLQEILDSDVPLIENICSYLNDRPGKRIRPTILFLTARSAGSRERDMVTAGLAIELVHTATLVHDDIIDDHMVRRGKPTVRARWGSDVATLIGDFLYSMALSCLAEARMFDVMAIISRVTHEMSTGELMQLQLRRTLDLNEDHYMDMIDKKTASLFSASCECGALIGGEKNGHRNKFSGFGKNMGLAFQIVDDLFDYVAAEADLGKPTASDFSDGRVTLPFITAFRNAPEQARKRVSDLFTADFDKKKHWGEIVNFVQNYGGVDYSLRRARDFADRAKGHLMDVSSSPERDALFVASDYVVERVHAFCK